MQTPAIIRAGNRDNHLRSAVGALLLGLAVSSACPTTQAVLFFSTADPSFNTSASGTVAETAWSYQGNWGSFMGTAVSPRHFITAKHVGGSVGGVFTFGGVSYTTTASYDAPAGVDLRIWRVSGTLPTFAPVYTASDEVGQNLVVIGRGRLRGTEVSVGGEPKGWEWGGADGKARWGENTVSTILSEGAADYLVAAFDANGGLNEAHLAAGDSGGGVFIQDPVDSLWKLAGINRAVDGLWSYDETGPGFNAAIYDQSGLFLGNDTDGYEDAGEGPSNFYATRISSYDNWILSVIPEPRHYTLATGLGLLLVLATRRLRRR